MRPPYPTPTRAPAFLLTLGLGLEDIARTIHPYPTQAEAIKKLGDGWLAWTR